MLGKSDYKVTLVTFLLLSFLKASSSCTVHHWQVNIMIIKTQEDTLNSKVLCCHCAFQSTLAKVMIYVLQTCLEFRILKVPVTYSEEFFCWPRVQCSVCNFCLFGQVFCTFYGGDHSLHSQESSQISSVRWYNNEREEPPDTSNNSTWQGSKHG